MQTANYAMRRLRLILLHKVAVAHLLGKLSFREGFEEVASRILEDARFDDIHPVNIALVHPHYRLPLTSLIIYCP